MSDKIKPMKLLVVEHNSFSKLRKGEPAIVPVTGLICAGDNYIVTDTTRPREITDVGVTVVEILYVEYPPEGCTTYNGLPCGIGRHTPAGRVITSLAVLYPVTREACATASSVEVVARWKKCLELQAQLLRVTSHDFGNIASTKSKCHPSFNGKSLDDNEFCTLTEKEQIECLERLAKAVLNKTGYYLDRISSAKSALG